MIVGLLGIFIALLLGELLVAAVDAPVPGSVVGMVIMLIFLRIREEVPNDLRKAGEGLLSVLPLLLVPAGVGLMEHFQLIKEVWWQILLILFVSTLITMVLVAKLLVHLQKGKGAAGE